LPREFAAAASQACVQNRIEIETLKAHVRRLRDFTYALAVEWLNGCGKTAAGKLAFRPDP
jgi:hypothetical protein